MQQFLKVFIFQFGNLVGFQRVFREFGSGKPFFPFFGSFCDIVNDTIVVAVDFFFEELGDPALSVLVSPEITKFLQISLLHKSFLNFIKS